MFTELLKSDLVPLDNVIEKLRICKQESEIELLQKACDIADAAFDHILTFITPGITEKSVEQELKEFMVNHGAESTWNSFIVARGVRGAVPKCMVNDKII